MSRVPYLVNIDAFICGELDEIRKMYKTLDFSSLPAIVERIQHHSNAMEQVIWGYKNTIDKVEQLLSDKDISESTKNKIKEAIKKSP